MMYSRGILTTLRSTFRAPNIPSQVVGATSIRYKSGLPWYHPDSPDFKELLEKHSGELPADVKSKVEFFRFMDDVESKIKSYETGYLPDPPEVVEQKQKYVKVRKDKKGGGKKAAQPVVVKEKKSEPLGYGDLSRATLEERLAEERKVRLQSFVDRGLLSPDVLDKSVIENDRILEAVIRREVSFLPAEHYEHGKELLKSNITEPFEAFAAVQKKIYGHHLNGLLSDDLKDKAVVGLRRDRAMAHKIAGVTTDLIREKTFESVVDKLSGEVPRDEFLENVRLEHENSLRSALGENRPIDFSPADDDSNDTIDALISEYTTNSVKNPNLPVPEIKPSTPGVFGALGKRPEEARPLEVITGESVLSSLERERAETAAAKQSPFYNHLAPITHVDGSLRSPLSISDLDTHKEFEEFEFFEKYRFGVENPLEEEQALNDEITRLTHKSDPFIGPKGMDVRRINPGLIERFAMNTSLKEKPDRNVYTLEGTLKEVHMTAEERAINDRRKRLQLMIEKPQALISRPLWPLKAFILEIRGVQRVGSGAVTNSSRVIVAVGNQHGGVGVGVASNTDVRKATKAALISARRDMIFVPLQDGCLVHDLVGKKHQMYALIKAHPKGMDAVKGSAVANAILRLAGVEAASVKVHGSHRRNPLTVAEAVLDALLKHDVEDTEALKKGLRREFLLDGPGLLSRRQQALNVLNSLGPKYVGKNDRIRSFKASNSPGLKFKEKRDRNISMRR